MHFSEALRLGIGVVTERRDLFLHPEERCGCALGTAEYARGRRHLLITGGVSDPEMLAAFPLLAREIDLEGSATPGRRLSEDISWAHVNGLSREAIAGKVEALERRFAEQPVEQPEAHVPVHL